MRSSFGSLACVALLSAALAPAVAACGDDEVAAPSSIALEDFARAYHEAVCDRLVRCNQMPDVETCLELVRLDSDVVQAASSATFGELTYDAEAGAACVQAISVATCEQGRALPEATREECDAVFGNRAAAGAPCYASSECEGFGSFCEGGCGDGCCEGVCSPATAGAPLGSPCDEDTPCDPEGYCAFDDETQALACVPLAGPGEDCVQGSCVAGYGCDPNSGRCFQLAESGADCNPNLAVNPCRSIGDVCEPEERTCVEAPGVGEPCIVNGEQSFCARYAFCVEGTCQLQPLPGEPCTNGVCLVGWCSEEDGLCQAPGSVQACL